MIAGLCLENCWKWKCRHRIVAGFSMALFLFAFIFSPASATADELEYFRNDDVGYEMYLPSSWLDIFEAELIDFTYEGAKNAGGKNFVTRMKDFSFQAEALTSNYYNFFYPIQNNIFSYKSLPINCLPGVVREDIQPWNTPGTQFFICQKNHIGPKNAGQNSYLYYEFRVYPEASGYGVHAVTYAWLFGSPYAGVRFDLKLNKISRMIERMMPCECEQNLEKSRRMQKRAEMRAKKYLQKLGGKARGGKNFPGIPGSDIDRLNYFFHGLSTFHEVALLNTPIPE